MGVPSFHRWLVNKYPKVVANAIEEKEAQTLFLDTTLPNPNGFEYDNLYLDMNGIIHPCFHPQDEDESISPPKTFEDVFNNMFGFIDRIFSIVRPRKLLYLAIDGVAPRAKMNQQRTRRFRNAKDREIEEEEELKVKKEFEGEGRLVLPKEENEVSDSNIITPGTEFMDKLSKALKIYIELRLSKDPGWKNIEVILSDANVPGEGEHKIMSFVRNQRSLPSYNPNTRHCLYGIDADLIILALTTHEVHFSILRKEVLNQDLSQPSSANPRGWFKNVFEEKKQELSVTRKSYQLFHVWILREYLELDMEISDPPENFEFDLERIIDDFIFICFFVGNDFLPLTPSLLINEGAIDLLMTVYKKELKNLGGYMVDMNQVNDKNTGYIILSRVEKFILSVGSYEEKIFSKRTSLYERKLRTICSADSDEKDNNVPMFSDKRDGNEIIDREALPKDFTIAMANISCEEITEHEYSKNLQLLKNTKDLKEKVKSNIRRKSDLFKNPDICTDKVRLGSPGYKERYYKTKFGAESNGEIESTRKKLVEKYTEGLLWILLYYFSGPPSWTWHYPFYYGPFLSDLKGLSQVKVKFQKHLPFKPFNQLLSALPPRSAQALPKAFRALMNDDSPIIDFYPSDFEIDMDGKRFTWHGICKLPFIDEGRLLMETKKLEKNLEAEEMERNSVKLDQLLFLRNNKSSTLISSDEICGSTQFPIEFNTVMEQEDSVICVLYEPLKCALNVPRVLDGVQYPIKTICVEDIGETQLWHESNGTKPHEKYRNNHGNSDPNVISYNSGGGRGRGRGRSNQNTNYGNPNRTESDHRPIFGWKNNSRKNTEENHGSYGRFVHKGAGSSGWSSTGRAKPRGDYYFGPQTYTTTSRGIIGRGESLRSPNSFWPSREGREDSGETTRSW